MWIFSIKINIDSINLNVSFRLFLGTGQMSGRADDHLHYQLDGSFSHSLLDTSFSLTEMLRATDKLRSRVNYKLEASSLAGLQASLYYSAQSAATRNSDDVSGDGTLEGSCQLGSSHINSSYAHSYNLRPLDGEGRGEWTLGLNSSLFHVYHRIHVVYVNSELNIVSKTSADNGLAVHAAELRYKDSQLTARSHAAARVFGVPLSNRVELGASSRAASLTIRSQADNDEKRTYSLVTVAVDLNGLEIISEAALMFDAGCRGLHKASFAVSRSNLSTNVAQIIQCSPVDVEVTLSGAIDSSKATLDLRTSAAAADSRGECTVEGKLTPQEASLYGLLTGRAYEAATRNDVNIVLNRRALTFTSNAMGAVEDISTENSHSLTLTLWTLTLDSHTTNFIQKDIYYKHNAKVDVKPFLMSFSLRNNLKMNEVTFSNGAYMKLEPFKVDLRGSVRGDYGGDYSLTHVYNLSYVNNYGAGQFNTTGIVRNAQLNHRCHLALAGFASASNCEARVTSEPLRFVSAVHAVAAPFSVTVDAFAKGDTEIHLQGNHTGQLDSKWLFKAEPLALTYSHASSLETLHVLQRGEMSTNTDNNFDGLLTPTAQLLTWKVKSKLNNSAYTQDVSFYNNPKKIGFNISCLLMTDLLGKYKKTSYPGRGTEELGMTAGLKYEKSRASCLTGSPFIKSFPDTLEQIKDMLVQALELLQQHVNNLNIPQLMVDSRARLTQLPKQVRDLVQEILSEEKIKQVKAKLDFFMKDFTVTIDDMETGMKKFRKKLESAIIDISRETEMFTAAVKDYVASEEFAAKVTTALAQVGRQLQAFDREHQLKQSLIKALGALQEFFKHVGIIAEWLSTPELKCEISETVRNKTLDMKQTIETFDIVLFVQGVRDHILSVEWAIYVDQLSHQISYSQISERIETMSDVILNWIDEYEIANKLNAMYLYVRDLLLRYGLGDSFNEFMDQAVILIKELKIDETVQLIVDALKSIDVHFVYENTMRSLQHVTTQVKLIDFKRSIDDLNQYWSSALKSMKEFDYGAFVGDVNEDIVSLTNQINEQLKKLDIVHKIEAVRVFFREIQSLLYAVLDELRRTKISDALSRLEKVIETTIYNDIKMKVTDIVDDVRQRISDMDIREEILFYLQRASLSYTNVVAFISVRVNQLLERIKNMATNNRLISQTKEATGRVLDGLRRAEIRVPTFVLPLTDLVIPEFTLNLNKLHDLQIPAQISVPEFTILGSYRIPGCTIDFDQLKSRIVTMIDRIRGFEIQMPDPEAIFGELKIMYLFRLPDLTFPEITLSEITFPAIIVPTLNLTEFRTEMPPIPESEFSEISSYGCIPAFGRLEGEFQVNVPQYTMVTSGKMGNVTSALRNPQFTAIVTSQATSPFEFLEHSFEATAHLEAPRLRNLLFTETVKATHTTFSVHHQGSLTVTQSSTEASVDTLIKVTTQMYQSDLANRVSFTLGSALSSAMNTAWDYRFFIAATQTASLASVKQSLAATVGAEQITLTGETTGVGHWSIQDYSDEGSHASNLKFNVNFQSAELYFVGKTNSRAIKLNQTMMALSADLQHLLVQVRCETDIPSVTKSIVVLEVEADPVDLKAALSISQSTKFTGNVIGSMENTVEVSVQWFEVVLDVENKVNTKVLLPLKLTGKVDLQQDYRALVTSERQRANWFALARFNQYHYNSNVTVENNEMDLYVHVEASGEANLGFLTVPLSLPNITIPYLKIQIPQVHGLSLWDYAGFKTLLTTPRQSFVTNRKLVYYKNTDKHS